MVDDEVDGDLRVNCLGICAQFLGGVAHGCQIDNRRDAGKVLHQDPGGTIGDFVSSLAAIVQPAFKSHDIFFCDSSAVFVP
ncbi:MAG: Uncharacterised protein [Hyphomonas sp. TMED17]|nr:MAG: Uncharacterised protein [Hyphomonas sp. TMED17]